MNRQLAIDALGWGFGLWLVGYILGIAFFFFMPTALIGWVITPIGLALMLWVLLARVKSSELRHYAVLAVVWTVIAVVCEYLLIVKAFQPADGYYKPDVYLYYAITFLCPLLAGWWKSARMPAAQSQ